MNINKRYLFPFILAAVFATLSACASNNTVDNFDNQTSERTTQKEIGKPLAKPSPSKAPITSKPVEMQPYGTKESPKDEIPADNSQALTDKKTKVTLYTSDAQCQELIPQETSVSSEKSLTEAVSKIIEKQETGDFSLSGYRINVKNGTATVDLRIASGSKRQLASLSSCEQFALFGSLRKTLTSNSQWKIKDVRFTEKGEEIVL